MIAEIIAVGSEMLTPSRQDTNSLFLTSRLNELGISVAFKTVVGDNREHLTSVARTAISRADISIFMGGLGPTEDDLTREAVADALGVELKRDHEIVTAMYKRFAERRLQMPENNAQQADVLQGAMVLPNSRGTAPGQWLRNRIRRKTANRHAAARASARTAGAVGEAVRASPARRGATGRNCHARAQDRHAAGVGRRRAHRADLQEISRS